ncbi:hypothetical protein CCS41_00495 [Candidatus Fukatsuia symbiotica]|uniref:Uncharacterized protein n=1 Tax=Candidatus Fukatsuia symbiotica TaxID=1878942 RepID=A0A2U8I635_9GAMM|nr:hypothetical protein CCS41_00495 [Candidatus Fukatsuia symbiotica]
MLVKDILKITYIPFAFQVAAALAARTHPSHVPPVHSWDSIDCRLAVTRNSFGIDSIGGVLYARICRNT